MIDIDYIELENGKNYDILDEITINNIKYLYLINENDTKDITIRKVDNNDNLLIIEDKKEYDKVMIEFMKKHRNDFAN